MRQLAQLLTIGFLVENTIGLILKDGLPSVNSWVKTEYRKEEFETGTTQV